jgi:hypothetical protein
VRRCTLHAAVLLQAAVLHAVLCGCSGASNSDTPTDASSNGPPLSDECKKTSNAVFERKIAPLLTDEHPATCGQCHLPGVDLQLFARETPCETYACLVQQGLVDRDKPENSVVLSWIGRAQPDSELVTDQVIAAEYDAFAEWLTAVGDCNACSNAKCGENKRDCAIEHEPDAAVREEPDDSGGCDGPSLEALFRDTVYAYRGRCAPCHVNDHEDPDTPMWIEAKFGCTESLTRTYNNVMRRGYLDVEQPEQSLLLLKPLAEAAGGVTHGGGDKFEDTNEPAYESFKHFIARYAACQM